MCPLFVWLIFDLTANESNLSQKQTQTQMKCARSLSDPLPSSPRWLPSLLKNVPCLMGAFPPHASTYLLYQLNLWAVCWWIYYLQWILSTSDQVCYRSPQICTLSLPVDARFSSRECTPFLMQWFAQLVASCYLDPCITQFVSFSFCSPFLIFWWLLGFQNPNSLPCICSCTCTCIMQISCTRNMQFTLLH